MDQRGGRECKTLSAALVRHALTNTNKQVVFPANLSQKQNQLTKLSNFSHACHQLHVFTYLAPGLASIASFHCQF